MSRATRRASSLYALVEDYYEELERVYDDGYQQQYGYWRPVIGEVMRKYLECGDLIEVFFISISILEGKSKAGELERKSGKS